MKAEAHADQLVPEENTIPITPYKHPRAVGVIQANTVRSALKADELFDLSRWKRVYDAAELIRNGESLVK